MNTTSFSTYSEPVTLKIFEPSISEEDCTEPKAISILIVDDERRLLNLMVRSCEMLGHKVAGVAHNGREAILLAESLQPDLIIMDVNMPEVDGIEAVEEILKTRMVPILMSTGNCDETTLRRARRSGVSGYLVKPFSPAQLKAAIHMALFQAFSSGPEFRIV